MNKYQETMSHIKVDDEMKKRILQNVQENLGKEKALSDRSEKIIYFKRLGTMAAMFAAAIIGVTAVMKFTGGTPSSSPSFDASPSMEMEATDSIADEAVEEAAEEAVAEETTEGAVAEEATENANRIEDYAKDFAVGESLTNAEPAAEEIAEPEITEDVEEMAEPEITEDAEEIAEPVEESTESESNLKTIVIAIIILLIAAISGFIYWRKRKNQL